MLLRGAQRYAAGRVPQGAPRINTAHPLARDLIDLVVVSGGALRSLVTGNVGASLGGTAVVGATDKPGQGRRSTASSGNCYEELAVPQWTRNASAVPGFTLWAWCSSTGVGSTQSAVASTRAPLAFFVNTSSNYGLAVGSAAASGDLYSSTTMTSGRASGVVSVGAGNPVHAFAVADPAGPYLDVPLIGQSSAAVSYTPSAAASAPVLRTGYANSSATHADKVLFAGAVWARLLSAEERLRIALDPHVLFEPRRIWVPVSAAGGGSVTLTAAQGSYSLTGQAAGLRVARTLTAAQGSYSLSGQAASIRTARQLVAGQGSYTLTGQAAALLATRRLVADQGAYALAGQSSALRAARQITAAQGSYALTGQDATLTYSGAGAKTLLADAGSYALTGQAAALRVARTLTAEQGAYTYTGQDAALRRLYTLTAGQGAYALTGQPAGILRGLRLPAAQGSYTLSGQAATLTYSGAAGSTISIVQPYITVYFWRRTA